MTEREALLEAVCADPQGDVPRLVYADWLDDHGEHDRADFIRVQCRIAAQERVAEQRSPELTARETALKDRL